MDMESKPMNNSHSIRVSAILIAIFLQLFLARAEEKKLVIFDNDFTGPPDSLSDLRSALMFLESPNIQVLGFTVVTGDGWRDEEVAHLLRLEQIASRTEVPVVLGAVMPLVRTPRETDEWQEEFSDLGYNGAFDKQRSWQPSYKPHPPDLVPKIPEGLPTIRPSDELAPEFMIRQVHAHPHEISIVAAGPLTDIALAVRTDPEFASLAKELVFMGGRRPPIKPDFNVRFDPEAAKIVLGAKWASITSVCDVTYKDYVKLDQADIDQISAANTPTGTFVSTYSCPDVSKGNLWDEICAAVLIDPAIVKETEDDYVDVIVDHQKHYGAIRLDCHNPLIDGQSKVRIVDEIDIDRFKLDFIQCMIGRNVASPTPGSAR
jgi:inosine-uridine nucleoside N-ribohydrolase